MDTLSRLQSISRDRQILFLAQAIGEVTISCRACYKQPDEVDQLRQGNEIIHRLVGHLRDICDPAESMTSSRLRGIEEQLTLLPGFVAERLTKSLASLIEADKSPRTRPWT